MKRGMLWILSVIAASAMALAVITPAMAATHSGTFNFPPGTQKITASFGTLNKARTCVTATKLNAGNKFRFQLVWYDGGKNLRLYVSPIRSTAHKAFCSPTVTLPRTHDKVYDIITDLPVPGWTPYLGGRFSIATN